jgi:hypothetical protein
MRQSKDDVEVTGGQDLVFSFFKPSFPWHMLAFGAVPITAGMIRNAYRATCVAALNMTTKVSGAAV